MIYICWLLTLFLTSKLISALLHISDGRIAALRAELAAEQAAHARLKAAINAWNAAANRQQQNTMSEHLRRYQPAAHWKTLGIEPTNDRDAIMKAFKAKVKSAHPDRGGSAHAFQQLFEARNQALANCK